MSDADILTRRLSREGCVLVGTQLETHHDELRHKDKVKLLPAVEEACQEAIAASKALEALDGGAEASMLEIDRGSDRCIAGLDAHCAAVAQCLDFADVLPLTPEQQARVAAAASLRTALFPAGTAFLRLPHRQQWERMSALVRATEQPDTARLLRQLGLT
ncbi:MAG: phosphoenolpyruvate--protein phosphotransferase, partial [Myxococcales bacterium]